MFKKIFQLAVLVIATAPSIYAQHMPLFYYGDEHLKDNKDHTRSLSKKIKGKKDNSKMVFFLFKADTSNINALNDFLYNQNNVDVFQSFSIQNFNNNNTYISSEFFSFLFGPVRMGVSGDFKTTKDTSQDNAIKSSLQKIITNGGEVSFNFSLPVFFYRNPDDKFHFGFFAQSNWGINPNIDTNGQPNFSNNLSFINQSGFLFHVDAGSSNSSSQNLIARLYLEIPCYYLWGSQNMYQQLGISDFSMINLKVGCVIGDLLSFHISGPLYSSSKNIQSTPFTLSLQFSPSQVAQALAPANSDSNGDSSSE